MVNSLKDSRSQLTAAGTDGELVRGDSQLAPGDGYSIWAGDRRKGDELTQ
jgi:hypothetical protein